MIEIVQTAIQLLLTGSCAVSAAIFYFRQKKSVWILLSLFSGSYFLGDLYWLLALIFYQKTPEFSYIANLNWYVASYVFLILLLSYIRDEDTAGQFAPGQMIRRHRALLLVPVFTGGMCIYYMQEGDYLANFLAAAFMTLIIMLTLDDYLLLNARKPDDPRCNFYLVVLLFCLAEYGLWTASRIWGEDSSAGAYFCIYFLLSCAFLLFPAALRKVAAEPRNQTPDSTPTGTTAEPPAREVKP